MRRTGRRPAVVLLLLLLLAVPVSPQDEDILDAVPASLRADVERALLAANEKALRACWEGLGSERERHAWAFLVGSLPREIVDGIGERVLSEHIRYAVLAWTELPWAEGVSRDVFHHWVLPPRPRGGEATAWRKKHYDELLPVLVKRKATNLELAALAVNRWCGKKGKDEDRALLFVRAARAMGVPARIVTTPWWTHRKGGGEWCEVFTGKGGWRFLEPGKPKDKLGEASFAKDARRAAVVLSRTIGRVKPKNRIDYERDDGSLVNSVGVYSEPCRMSLEVVGPKGKPALVASVAMYVFNEEDDNAYMRPAFFAPTDDDGRFSFDLGPGDYLFHARDGRRVGWAVARSAPGESVTCRIVVTDPASDERSSFRKSGVAGLVLNLGSGGGGDMTAAVSHLSELPWDPFTFVGGGGQFTSLEPGFYSILTSWRRNPTTVLVSVQAVEVRKETATTLRTPDFPKGPRKAGIGAWVLRYPGR